MEEPDNLSQLSNDLMDGFGNNPDLAGIMLQQDNLYTEEQEEGDENMEDNNDETGDDNEPDDIIILHMDIRQPLRTLGKIVERKLGVELKGYKFFLQDSQELESHKNLVDQCVKGEGLVQINVQVQTFNQRINIVDVLKPTEAALAALGEDDTGKDVDDNDDNDENQKKNDVKLKVEETQKDVEVPAKKPKLDMSNLPRSIEKPCLNWVLDRKFRKEQTRLKIPDEPLEWSVMHVQHWFQWATREFELKNIHISDWNITGKELCALTHEEFRRKIQIDPGNVFWTHLQLLKECKFVSVVHKEVEEKNNEGGAVDKSVTNLAKEFKIMRKTYLNKCLAAERAAATNTGPALMANTATYSVGSGNNGQVQLWQFLLDLLTDRSRTDVIQWVGNDGEFRLTDPERVARLWGEKKNKPAMNYEKLSRALRYYYDGDMISKVSGKRFAYKFDCDLKLLIGFDAAELSRLVNEKPYMDEAAFLESLKSDDE